MSLHHFVQSVDRAECIILRIPIDKNSFLKHQLLSEQKVPDLNLLLNFRKSVQNSFVSSQRFLEEKSCAVKLRQRLWIFNISMIRNVREQN